MANIHGTNGSDHLTGTLTADVIYGYRGNDILLGYSGSDVLRGGRGRDVLRGGSGNDFLQGGPGTDILTGGSGADIFYFGPSSGQDIITDFSSWEGDSIIVNRSSFGLQASTLGSHDFNHNFEIRGNVLSYNDQAFLQFDNISGFDPSTDIQFV